MTCYRIPPDISSIEYKHEKHDETFHTNDLQLFSGQKSLILKSYGIAKLFTSSRRILDTVYDQLPQFSFWLVKFSRNPLSPMSGHIVNKNGPDKT